MSVEPRLEILLRAHRDRFALHYRPDWNSDHGPMACLALAGLGASFERIARFAPRYQQKLSALKPAEPIDAQSYRRAFGRVNAYPAFLAFFDREIAEHSAEATLLRYLPEMISGWVRDAYHALIRLGYGIEFDVHSEIAAGLAYLAVMGPDPSLERAARATSTDDPLAAARGVYEPRFGSGTFAQRYDAVMTSGVLASCIPEPTDALRRASRTCLDAFDSTWGFFALHLVTSSHAMRMCAPFAGQDAERVLWAGALAGYLCIGAPSLRADDAPRTASPDLAIRDPEHLTKLAWSARSQARAFGDPAFEAVATRYLAGTDPLSIA